MAVVDLPLPVRPSISQSSSPNRVAWECGSEVAISVRRSGSLSTCTVRFDDVLVRVGADAICQFELAQLGTLPATFHYPAWQFFNSPKTLH